MANDTLPAAPYFLPNLFFYVYQIIIFLGLFLTADFTLEIKWIVRIGSGSNSENL